MNFNEKDSQTLGKGFRFLSAAISVMIAGVLLFALTSLGSIASSSPGLLGVGAGVLGLFFLIGTVLSIVGKIFCLSTPVYKELVMVSVAADLIGMVTGLLGRNNFSGLVGLISTGVFMVFLYKLANAIPSARLIEEVLSTAKKYALGFVLTVGGGFSAMISPLLSLPLMLGGVVTFVLGFLSYVRCLNFASQDVVNVPRSPDSPVSVF